MRIRTIRSGEGWEIYEDAVENLFEQDHAIHVEMRGVTFTAGLDKSGQNWIDVRLSRAMARQLGLIPPDQPSAGAPVRAT